MAAYRNLLKENNLETENCVVYPPVAFRTNEADTTRWEKFVENIENFITGNPQNIVN